MRSSTFYEQTLEEFQLFRLSHRYGQRLILLRTGFKSHKITKLCQSGGQWQNLLPTTFQRAVKSQYTLRELEILYAFKKIRVPCSCPAMAWAPFGRPASTYLSSALQYSPTERRANTNYNRRHFRPAACQSVLPDPLRWDGNYPTDKIRPSLQ